VQLNAKGMDSIKLKKEFENDISFCGGGIDTQYPSRRKNEPIKKET
jgi:hypothetical protein